MGSAFPADDQLTAGQASGCRPAESEKPGATVLPPRERARSRLLFVAHVVRRRSRAARVVMTSGRAVLGGADRFLLAHVMRDFGLRAAAIVVTVLFLVGGLLAADVAGRIICSARANAIRGTRPL